MKTLKKPLSCLLALIMLASVLFATPFDAFAAETFYVSTAQDLTNACAQINQNGGVYTISLQADISGNIGITNSNATVTVVGNGHTLSCAAQAVDVWNGATVNLGDGHSALTLKGGIMGDTPGIVYVYGKKSICNMYAKVTLKDHKGENYFGGGVTVQEGTFCMYGGTIENCGIEGGSVCFGGGVAVINGGRFVMTDGTISNCYVHSDYVDDFDPNHAVTAQGGGVFVTGGSTFVMNGGTITGCNATNFGGGVAIVMSYFNELQNYKFGNLKSTAEINDGTISGNTADSGAGVFASGYFYAFAAAFGYPLGSGNTNGPGLLINGGEISSNRASGMGGGVLIAMLRPAVNAKIKNAEIKNNTASAGAGVMNYGYWTRLDLDGCTITGNTSDSYGGGVMASGNSSNGYTQIRNTKITANTAGDRGAGVFYDANSRLTISGANTIQGNLLKTSSSDAGKLNNLNIYKENGTVYPVYVGGALTGSQIGLSDPKLWDDNKADTDPEAVSEDYLTSDYNTNNSGVNPITYFTSDHEGWYADFSDVSGKENEVRLFRINNPIEFHVNAPNKTDRLYTVYNPKSGKNYVTEVDTRSLTGGKISSFYDIPDLTNDGLRQDDYVFAGWYCHSDGNKDGNVPFEFGSTLSATLTDVYAHWIPVGEVDKDENDDKILPEKMNGKYKGFELFGVQIRPEANFDHNLGDYTNGGLRFVTSISEALLSSVDALSDKTVDGNKVEYGFVTASEENVKDAMKNLGIQSNASYKLQYRGVNVNGVDTIMENKSKDERKNKNNFRYVTNVDCTSKVGGYGKDSRVKIDHRNYENKYRLATFVIQYDDNESNKTEKVVARAYMRYYDANGLLRTFYNDYGGTSVYGGCSTSFAAVKGDRTDPKELNKLVQ